MRGMSPSAILRTARRARGLSLDALARLAGIDRCTIHRVERGRQAPTASTLLRLRHALESAPEEIQVARTGVLRGTRQHLRDVVPYELDAVARYAVTAHPDGLEIEQIAQVLGLHPRSVDRAQARALGKLRHLASQQGAEGELVRLWLARIAEAREVREAREGHAPDAVDEPQCTRCESRAAARAWKGQPLCMGCYPAVRRASRRHA